MNSPKNYLVLLLAATTVGGAMLAWRQYSELVELRAAAMNKDERADLQKRVWDLEKSNRELQDQLAIHRETADAAGLMAADSETERPARGRGDRGGDPRGRGNTGLQQANAIRELMNKPEVQAMLSVQQKAAIDARYAALFKNLNLQPEQIDRLKSLLLERSTTMQDVMAAAREQGVNPRENPEAFRKLVTDAQDEVNASIKSVIGDQGFAQLASYEQTMPQRSLVNELQQRLSYTSTPLTPAQAEQMVQILATNAPQRQAGTMVPAPGATAGGEQAGGRDGGRGPGGPGGFGGRGGDMGAIFGALGGGPGIGMLMEIGGRGGPAAAPVTSAAVSQAQTVLAPPQLAALQQIQQQQQTQQQLRQLVSETLTANQPATKAGTSSDKASGAAPATGTGGTAPTRRRGAPGGE